MRRASLSILVLGLVTTFFPVAYANEINGPAPAISGAVKGGELVLYKNRDFRSFDPVRFFNTNELTFSTFIFRPLTQFRTINGKSELLPDLAADLGTSSKDFRTWTFKLRKGIKYSDGSLVTCDDVKYNVMRSFADDVLTQGPPYAKMYLQTSDNYLGPYKEPNKDLKSVVCSKDKTKITFNLNRSVPYFNQVTVFPTFSPVPKRADTGLSYGRKPLTTGPYQVKEYLVGREALLVRNPHWNPRTDPIRWNYPDQIRVKIDIQPTLVEQMLVSDSGEAQRAAMMGLTVIQNRREVNNFLNLKNRSHTIFEVPMFLVINTEKVTNLKVRKSMQCAIDYRGVVAAAGGQQYSQIVTSTMPEKFKDAYVKYEICGRDVTEQPAAKIAQARKLLSNTPESQRVIRFGYSDSGLSPLIANSVARSLEQVGFKVSMIRVPILLFAPQARDRKNDQFDLLLREPFRPDWQLASGYASPLLDARAMTESNSGSSWSRQNFPEIQKLLIQADKAISIQEQEQIYGQAEKLATKKYAFQIPLVSQRLIFLHGSKVGGVEIAESHNVLTFASAFIKK